jgi:hypothetical protein
MDIHPPSGAIHSLKDFAVHILIVTIGILIALSLEGAREAWKEHKAVAEARAGFQRELRLDQDRLRKELASVADVNSKIEMALSMLPDAVKSADTVKREITEFAPGFYFFKNTAWESAIAEGVLAHMDEEEVNRFEDAYLSLKNYQDAQKSAIPEWISVAAWFGSHRVFTNSDLVDGEERLRLLRARTLSMQHLGEEFTSDLKDALGN